MATNPISISGVDATTELLDGLAARIADTTPLAVAVRAIFLAVEAKRFAEQGPGWAALAESTLTEKARKGYPSDILVETGALKASLTEEDAEGAVFVPVFGPFTTEITMGTDLKAGGRGSWADWALGAFHQMGTSKMPSRPIIDDQEVLAADWAELLATWLSTGGLE